MTEKQTDSAASMDPLPPLSMLLMRAGRIAGFDGREGWPDAFTPKELAALQYDDKDKQGDLIALLTPMIYRHEIESVTVMRPPIFWIGGVPETYKEVPEPGIERPAAAAFLNAIHEEPGELVREWLGSDWQPAPPPKKAGSEKPEPPAVTTDKVKKWDVAGSWEQQARAFGQGWMLEQRKLLKEADWPGVEAIAKHVEGVLSTREITGKRGKYLDWETIKREALTGITGRKAKGKK
jgi:hypothetical protein